MKRLLGRAGARDDHALADPYPLWNRLREEAPVHRLGPQILVSRYDDVKVLCRDASDRYGFSYGQSEYARQYAARLPADHASAFHELWGFQGMWMGMTTGDYHARLRRVAHRAFTPARVAELRESMRRDTAEMLTPLIERDRADIMEVAYRLPLKVVLDLLDCPQEDLERLDALSTTLNNGLNPHADADAIMSAHEAMRALMAYVRAWADDERAASERTDLVAALLDARAHDLLTEDELAAMFVMLLFAGHETTVNLIGHGLHQLLLYRDQWRLLCADPTLWPTAIDELLRFVSPVQFLVRPAAEPHEFGGVEVGVGDMLVPVLAAANRDPAVFDAPDALDVGRAKVREHLAFGFGAKFCLGNAIARMQGIAVLGELARRFPDMELATDELHYTGTPALRQLEKLPVVLGTAGGG